MTFSSSAVNWLSRTGTVLNSASAAGRRCYSFWRNPEPVVWKIYDPAPESMQALSEGPHHLMDLFLI